MSPSQHARIGIGMVGAGFLAETRSRCYARIAGIDAEIVAVTSRSPESASSYADRHGIRAVTRDLDELLRLDEVDVVDLCVPNALHRGMTERAARAGKHVICTKPLAAYVGQDLGAGADDEAVAARDRAEMLRVADGEATAMVEAAARAGVQLMYGENWVYAPAITRALGLLRASGGTILEMHGWECHKGSHSPYARSWRHSGGGALLRLGAHPVGAMLHLKHTEGVNRNGVPIRPVAVTAEVADLSRIASLTQGDTGVATGWKDVENWGTVVIAFEDGSRGVAHGSDNLLGGMESQLAIRASNCHLRCRLSPVDMLQAYAATPQVFEGEYIMEKADAIGGWSTPMPDEDWTSGHVAMCQDFVSAVAAKRPALAGGTLGRAVTRVIYAAYLSASEGRRVTLGGDQPTAGSRKRKPRSS